jgi:ABC-type branched-subunit amino acid transport system ATPase component
MRSDFDRVPIVTTATANKTAHQGELLSAEAISKRFGGVQALKDVSFAIGRNEVVGLIGPNGSGKSTCVNLLSGLLPVSGGQVRFKGDVITGRPIYDVVARGLARTFQATQVFPEYTARQNVLIGCHSLFKSGAFGAISRAAHAVSEHHEMTAQADEVLDFVGLGARKDHIAATLSAAEQRLLMIAVALAAKPDLVLLDEPAAGMVAGERRALARIIRDLPQRGTSALVIEHHMGLIMEVCDRIVVLNFGQKIAEGTPAEIRANQTVIDAYLGHRDHA